MPTAKPEIVITYCTQCQWLLRAAWLAQELLSTFADDLGKVCLEPGTGGVFRITCDGVQVWERKADGGFPEAKASIDVQLRTSEHRSMYSYVRLSIDRCTATYV